MKLYVDDERNPKTNGWVIARSAADAILVLSGGHVTEVSLDHDLGTEETGYDIALYIEASVYLGNIPMPKWNVHSANPVGRKRIEAAMKNAERFSERSEENDQLS